MRRDQSGYGKGLVEKEKADVTAVVDITRLYSMKGVSLFILRLYKAILRWVFFVIETHTPDTSQPPKRG
jgi:hypothetical protein